ncbi:MAG: phage tail protein, partial [Oscillospiraceae bacterium]
MYENVTREVLLKRMLARIPDRFDKREGSVIYDALAPAAGELQMLYLELDRVLRESFADTQSRDFLILRGAERGVVPRAASAAIRKGRFNKDVPLGTRFSRNSLTYAVFERMEPGVFKLAC